MLVSSTCQSSVLMAQESESTMRRKRFQRGSLAALAYASTVAYEYGLPNGGRTERGAPRYWGAALR